MIALFPLPGALLLPGGQLPLNIFEPRYLRMIDDVLATSRTIGMVQTMSGATAGEPALYSVGCAGRLTSFNETDDGRYVVNLTGMRRFSIVEEIDAATPYRQANVDYAAFARDAGADPTADAVDRDRLEMAMRDYLEAEGLKTDWDAVGDAPTQALIVSLAMGCPFKPAEKQALLEAADTAARAECLIALMEMSRGDGGDDTTTVN
ncbi:MAG: LON peptidase substrate-binding domain-containing protein [Parvularculaceae bacterium]